ncbi:MAG: DUF3995 domain-containing protein [Beutenbergiaceae bacterium]
MRCPRQQPLHLAWALGSTWPAAKGREFASTILGVPGMTAPPPAAASVTIAGLLAAAAGLVGARVSSNGTARALGHAGTFGIAAILAARAAGGVIESGLLPQRVTHRFRTLDLTVYSPVCLALAAGTAFVRARPQPTD